MANYDETYAETIMGLRQEAATRQIENVQAEVRRLRDEVYENERLASEAIAAGDRDTALAYADSANAAEQQYIAAASYLPQQQQQQVDPRLAEFVARHENFFNKYGQAGVQGFELAHQYATRPRTGSNNPAMHGMGLQFGTPEYFSAVKDLMTMYGKDYGLNFDPSEQLMTPDEAAKISGISPREYNRGVKQMIDGGKDSATEYSHQWERKTG